MSKSLMYLRGTTPSLHEKAKSYWLKPNDCDELELQFLASRSAKYIATFISEYPEYFLTSSDEKLALLKRLNSALSRKQHLIGVTEQDSLQVVASLPPEFILGLDTAESATIRPNLLDHFPSTIFSADALNTLARVFEVPSFTEFKKPWQMRHLSTRNEGSASLDYSHKRACFRGVVLAYLSKNNGLFSDLVTYADTLADKRKAIAATNVMRAIARADWDHEPKEDSKLENINAMVTKYIGLPRNSSLPASGVDLMLSPHNRPIILPYLLKPATKFSSLLGGRGDPEQVAYQVAMAKFDLLHDMERSLNQEMRRGSEEKMDEYRQLHNAIQGRIRQGPFGVSTEVGGRIATLEL
jgi:hypothetical protein